MAKNTKTKVKKNQVVEKKVTSKKILLWIFLVLLVVAIALGLKSFFPCNHLNKEDFKITSFDGKKQKALFRLEIADTEATRLKGLMYRKELPENTGMIFDFEKPDYYAMWMKNTYIPLDMIFLNNDGVVVTLAPNREPLTEDHVSPCNVEYEIKAAKTPIDVEWDIDAFFDECEARFSKPNKLIRYVIEVPAGTIKANGIKLGDKLSK